MLTTGKEVQHDIVFILSLNMQDITQSDVAVADTENTEMAYKNEIRRYIQQKWCRQADMGQVPTTLPTYVLATALMPNARANNLILLNLKGGMFNIQTEAVGLLGTCHTADKISSLQSHLMTHPVHLIKLVITDSINKCNISSCPRHECMQLQ